MTERVLDVRLALTDRRLARARLVGDLLRGRLTGSDHLERFVTDCAITADVTPSRVSAALDAEVVRLSAPLVFTPASRHVRVLVPPGA